jgi:hypothetical protein
MRVLAFVFTAALTSFSGVAAAAPALDLSTLPQRCREVAAIPRSSRIADPALSARVSAATCVVDRAVAGMPLTDGDASVQALDAATAPIIATLDEVAAHGGPEWQIVALYMKADILFGLATRLRSSIPLIDQNTSLEAAADIQHRHEALEVKLVPWVTRATAAFGQVAELARANPRVANADPVMKYMVGEATQYTGMAQGAEPMGP